MDRPLNPDAVPSDRRIQVAAVTTTLVGSLPVWLTGALAVQIGRDLTFGPARLGVASGAFFGAAAIGSALMGRVAERTGPGRAMRVAGVAGAITMAGLGLSPGYPTLLVALIAAGFSNALAQVGANLLVARHIAPARQGWSMALKQAGVPGGTLLGGLAVPVIALTFGWRWAYAAGAVLAVSAVALVPVGSAAPRPPVRRADSDDLPLRPLVLLAVAVAFAAAANGSLATFLVSAGVEAGIGESEAGLILTVGSALGISSRLLAGYRADRRGGRHLPVVSLLLLGGSAGYLLLAPGGMVTHLAGAAVAFGSGWAWPGLFNLAIVRLNPAAPAAATGITQTGVYVGALSGPIAFGVIVDQVGYGWAWTVAAICSVGAAAGVRHGRNRILAWRAGHVVAATD